MKKAPSIGKELKDIKDLTKAVLRGDEMPQPGAAGSAGAPWGGVGAEEVWANPAPSAGPSQ